MHRLRIAVLFLLVAVLSGACASRAATPSDSPSAAAPSAAAPSAAAPSAPSGVQSVGLSEWKVVMASTMKAGQVNFAITNAGTAPHELLVFKSDLAVTAYPKDSAGSIVEDGPGVTLVSDGDNIEPSGSQARTVDLTVPGTYLFVCNIPGHFQQGMFTVVTVTP